MTTTLLELIRRHPMRAYLVWFFTVGWAISFVPVIADALWGTELHTQPFAIATTLVGGLLPAIVITRLVDGPEGLRALLRRVVKVRASLGWYAVALIALPVPAVVLALLIFGAPDATASTLVPALVSGLLLQTIVTFVTVNFAEEIGWMGFVQARLQAEHGALRAAVLTGPLFALQHVPGMVSLGAALVIAFPAVILLSIGYRVVMGWLYNRTGSLVVVGLAHAVGNGATGGSGFADGLLPRLYDSDFVGVLHLVGALLVGLAIVAATRERLALRVRAQRPTAPAAVPSR